MILTILDCFSASGALSLSSTCSSFSDKSMRFFGGFNRNLEKTTTTTTTRMFRRCKASLITNPESFQVGRLIGSYGFMNITSYSGLQSGLGIEYSSQDVRLGAQEVGEGNVKIRLYEGRIAQGPLRGTPIIFKVYPGQQVGGIEAEMMAANELNTQVFLQSSSSERNVFQNLQILLGGFETKTGEQWLAFRNDGKYSAADYAKVKSEKMSKYRVLGENKFWNRLEQEQTIKRRRYYVVKLLHGALCGLAYMHDQERLHQSLGPASVVLNTMVESEAPYLVPRLRDLAFSVDIRYSQLEEGSGTFSEGLWRRASAAGAFTPMEKRAFGIADDIYEAGLLFAYLAFIPFCEAGIMDSLSLQRLLESTFRLDLEATREYCLADDRLSEAVKFLDLGAGAGWELLQAMLNPDFRKRPIAEAILNHRFMTGSVL
ncbi:Serine/threonine-protein kinase [Actinidia chinensis var. chinensis]|uniref:Serine/threonine-protein kinase n=1 Tax=Actinidia chinensis var. chinensis TaxID=1590841 RepID=A0A2R6Q9H2_ACTCC|nr:Serine/threonine-protein kinase [Actinidia chinensis var. chinensis]